MERLGSHWKDFREILYLIVSRNSIEKIQVKFESEKNNGYFTGKHTYVYDITGLFISPSGISELDCATTKTDTAERIISIGRESLQVFFVLVALAYFQVPPLGGSRDEKWRSQ